MIKQFAPDAKSKICVAKPKTASKAWSNWRML